MVHRPGWRFTAVLAAALAAVLAFSAVALASGLSSPVLKAPHNGGRVHTGRITLIAKDPGVPNDVRPVYVAISPKRKLDRYGHLYKCLKVSRGCEFIALRPWHGHPGMWKYTATVGFPGYWAVTPGKYFWQAEHTAPLCHAKGCEVVSKIGTFRVVG
jgi:hypothetical protein